jgi:hypothetical protein
MHNQDTQSVLQMDQVTVLVSATGSQDMRGVFNFIQSVVEMRDSTVVVTNIGNQARAIDNTNATTKMRRVSASAAGSGGDQLGVVCTSPTAGAFCTVEMDDVRIQAVTHTVKISTDHPGVATMRINASYLNGGDMLLESDPSYPVLSCQAVYDETNTFFANTCP